jgi:hypothetical protein
MEEISDCSAIDIALGSRPDTDVLLEPFVLEVFSPSPKGDTAPTTSSEDMALVEKCGALIERIQWLFKSDQYTFDAYGYEYSGMGLWPVLVQPRVDPDAAKRLLLDILVSVDLDTAKVNSDVNLNFVDGRRSIYRKLGVESRQNGRRPSSSGTEGFQSSV